MSTLGKMIIRKAKPEDAEILARIHIDSWRAAYKGLVPDSYLKKLDYRLRAESFRKSLVTGPEETFLGEDNKIILGFVTLGRCRDEDLDHEITGEIWGIYLDPFYWKQGYGYILCRKAEIRLAEMGYQMVTLWVFTENRNAIGFYKAMGYEPDGTFKILNPGTKLEACRLRKQISSQDLV